MSVIEQAAKRLEELQRAGVQAAQTATSVEVETPAGESAAPRSPLAKRREPESPARVFREPAVQESNPSAEQASAASRRVELNLSQIAAAGIVTPDAPRSRVADEFRVVKRPLLANAARRGETAVRNGNLIM